VRTLLIAIKATFETQGAKSSWSMMKRISPAIPTLLAVITHFEQTINRYQRYRAHTSPDYEKDVNALLAYYKREGAYKRRTPKRKILSAKKGRKVVDALELKDNPREGARLLLTGKTLRNWVETRTVPRSTEQNFDALHAVCTCIHAFSTHS
jgi:hypothetical protein